MLRASVLVLCCVLAGCSSDPPRCYEPGEARPSTPHFARNLQSGFCERVDPADAQVVRDGSANDAAEGDAAAARDAAPDATVDAGCASNAGCQNADASRCDMGECTACVDSDDCGHLEGRGLCASGSCVACTARNDDACSKGVCDVRNGICTELEKQSAGPCDACVSSKQCGEGQACVQLPSDGRPDSFACAFTNETFENSDCQDRAGLVSSAAMTEPTEAKSVDDGAVVKVCDFEFASCEAQRAHRNVSCTPPEASMPEPCGIAERINDGYCVELSPGNSVCTIRCNEPFYDCPRPAEGERVFDCVAASTLGRPDLLIDVCGFSNEI